MYVRRKLSDMCSMTTTIKERKDPRICVVVKRQLACDGLGGALCTAGFAHYRNGSSPEIQYDVHYSSFANGVTRFAGRIVISRSQPFYTTPPTTQERSIQLFTRRFTGSNLVSYPCWNLNRS